MNVLSSVTIPIHDHLECCIDLDILLIHSPGKHSCRSILTTNIVWTNSYLGRSP